MQQHLTRQGFTLVELMVVISIMGILASSIFIYASQSGRIGRDADRQADLRSLQSAVELYKQREGRYPEGCNGPNRWSGELGMGTGFECSNGSTLYITGLAPTYIPVLPRDPRRGCTADCGYAYVTNDDGTVYKLIARKSVESEVVDYSHPMKSCDVKVTEAGSRIPNERDIRLSGVCGRLRNNTTGIKYFSHEAGASGYGCQIRTVLNGPLVEPFNTSYGVWGGFAKLAATVSNNALCINPGAGQKCVDEFAVDPLTTFTGAPTAPDEQNDLRVHALTNTAAIICK